MAAGGGNRLMTDDEWTEVSNLIWPNPDYVEEDQLLEVRLLWFNQSLRFAVNTVGFEQPKNGPCGALSGLQAMLLRHYLFDTDLAQDYNQMVRTNDEGMFAFIEVGAREALARGIASSLWRAATIRLEHKIGLLSYVEDEPNFVTGGPKLVLPSAGAFVDPLTHSAQDFFVLSPSSNTKASFTDLVRNNLDQLVVEGGVILFLYSLVLSRGGVPIRRDLNDQYGSCRFILDGWGFCGQALVNFIIGGTATSDVSGVIEYAPATDLSGGNNDNAADDANSNGDNSSAPVDVVEVISRQQIKGQPGQYEYEVTYRRAAGELIVPPRGDEKWRCLACTMKVPVEWNAWNDPSATNCKECGKALQECGRCIWVPFARLSATAQRDVETRYGKSAVVAASTAAASALPKTYHMNSELIGFLTSEAPVGPHLQNPGLPIWIVHGGAHYTTLFCMDGAFSRTEDERMIAIDRTPNPVNFWHFNGLPPGGPRMSTFVCTWDPPIHHDAMFESAGGESEKPLDVERLIARRQAIDGVWEYEVVAEATVPVPTLLDPATPRSTHLSADFYEADIYTPPRNDANWRCLACTTAPMQVWSAINPATSPTCKECNRPLTEVGRCLWLRYARLPFGKQRQVDRDYAPAILQVIQTKYAGVYLEFEDGYPEPSI